jgi:hypothetical protein
VVHGHHDIMQPPINAYTLAQRIPRAELIIYPDSGMERSSSTQGSLLIMRLGSSTRNPPSPSTGTSCGLGRRGDRAGGLPGREVERFGMGPAVVLGQGLADSAGPVRDRAVADLATRDREMSDRYREAAGR